MPADTRTGRKAIRGKVVIDDTWDGDVAANAGLPFDFGRARDGAVQATLRKDGVYLEGVPRA